jgi:hypothetical protein
MTDKQHTLDDLFSDSGPFDESAVVKAIMPFITIQKNSNEIFFKESALTVDERILVYGLAKKLLKMKGVIESDYITALDFHQKTGIKKGSVDPMFKKLKDSGMLVGKKEYEIPNHKVSEIIMVVGFVKTLNLLK